MNQTTNDILMVQPWSFTYNTETAVDNYFQHKSLNQEQSDIQKSALKEYDAYANALSKAGVNIISIEHIDTSNTPDAVFPNNWVSFHQDGGVILYPIYAPNRRLEKRVEILDYLESDYNFEIKSKLDLSSFEQQNLFLESTGSMILDRVNKIIYASKSERTSFYVLKKLAKKLNYNTVTFNAEHFANGQFHAIYHTNVLMCLGNHFAIVCLESIKDKSEKQLLLKSLEKTEKEVIEISMEQLTNFAGNMLEVKDNQEQPIIAMSAAAYNSLNKNQIKSLERHGQIVYSSLATIEKYGGGSARCMMAEIFLPKR